MVAKITVPKTIRRALNYNEQKVKEGVAKCIYARNFLKEAEGLNFYEKLARFESLIALNKRAETNTVHISLNFAVEENVEREKLVRIATKYMEKIGFEKQPYVVYQHLDAGHPHIHIVTTNIQRDGQRISLHNIGKDKSEKARRELETSFDLVRADGKKKVVDIKPVDVPKVIYGRSATKRAIINALDAILPTYNYSSLAELNAVLRLYNIVADRGKEDGLIYQKRGLYYRVLNSQGEKIGVPIKSSSIYSKPTLDYLEKQFIQNEVVKQRFKKSLKSSIDWIMVKPPCSLEAFKLALEKEKISLVVRQNEVGIIYGLTYIDHKSRCVFNGSEIGKEYSAKAILEKCSKSLSKEQDNRRSETRNLNPDAIELSPRQTPMEAGGGQLLDNLITPKEQYENVPFELRKQKRKISKKR